MKNRKETIRKIVGWLNNEEKEGGFWLPNIQRPFVWREDQIERLFDSIMREYPISTLLLWKTESKIRCRRFIDNYRHGLKLTDFYVPDDNKTKFLVLDGQQRLQSLFIGLKGSYEKKELFIDILSGDLVAPEDVRFRFRFLDPAKAEFPWVKFKDVVFSKDPPHRLQPKISSQSSMPLEPAESERILDNLYTVWKVFAQEENITYQELDSVDQPELYTEDDVVEIFIRANAGGTRLGKSDLLFSLLSASWDVADEQMDVLLDDINHGEYDFTRDFVLKSCLCLLGKGARYDVAKFRDGSTKEAIIDRWQEISEAIRDVRDFVYGSTFIRTDKALPSYLGLIPLIYFRFHYRERWNEARGIDTYLLRTLLTGAFSGTPDNLIDRCIRTIDEEESFQVKSIFGVVRADNRSLEITPETLWEIGYGSKAIHLIFNLWYRDFDYQPTFSNSLPQVDHIFPQSLLRTVKRENPETGKMNMLRYYADERNQLANCMLLSAEENGAGGKGDMPPAEWLADKSNDYLAMHLIPKDPNLWELDRFEEFVAARKLLILNKFGYLLQSNDDEREKYGISIAV